MSDDTPQPEQPSPDPLGSAVSFPVEGVCERHGRWLAWQVGESGPRAGRFCGYVTAMLLRTVMEGAGLLAPPGEAQAAIDADKLASELAKGPLCCRVEEIAFRAIVYLVQMKSLRAQWRHAQPTEGCRVCLS